MTTVRAVGGPIATPPWSTPASARGGRPWDFARRCRGGPRGRPGVAIGLVSAMCFGTSGTFGTALIGAGWSPAGAVFARVLVAALALTVPAVLALRGRWRVLLRSAWQVTVYGLVGVAACQVCYFNAIARMPVGISIMLEYLGHRAHRALAVGAARADAAAADHRRRRGRARRARADAQPVRQRRR